MMNVMKLFRYFVPGLMLVAGLIGYDTVGVQPVFATDQAATVLAQNEETPQIQPQEPVQPSEANPRIEPEQIQEAETVVQAPPQEEQPQQPNEPDEIEQPVPPLNQ